MTEILTFADALALSGTGKRHLLLGNGFSIAYDPNSFSYGRLLDEADFSECSIDVRQVFDAFGTTDFEKIIEILRTSAILLSHYAAHDPDLAAQIADDAKVLKDALARVLAERHPDLVGSLSDDEYLHVRTFLSHFERLYTLNYDLLMYWATMQDVGPSVSRDDGFRNSQFDADAPWVAWDPKERGRSQRIFYMHGALHLFDAGDELQKNTWNRTGVPILTQTREALEANMYPLVVTEGNSNDKFAKILHSGYLLHAYRSFAGIGGSLFIYGHSLAASDEHVLRLIEEGSVAKVFVSLYGSASEPWNLPIIERANRLPASRAATAALGVHFFDAESARVWR